MPIWSWHSFLFTTGPLRRLESLISQTSQTTPLLRYAPCCPSSMLLPTVVPKLEGRTSLPAFKPKLLHVILLGSTRHELSLLLFHFYHPYSIVQIGAIYSASRNINNLRYADDTTLMAESEELKSLLMKVKEESKKLA